VTVHRRRRWAHIERDGSLCIHRRQSVTRWVV
jgi:hypothetical protein